MLRRDRSRRPAGRRVARVDRARGVRVLAYRPDVDGRIVAAGALAVYLLAVAIPRIVSGIDIWPALGVPSGPSLFFDTRNLTAALECRRLGFDPLVESPCDPWGRPLNYPRVWLALRFLGLDQSDTVALALLFIALFLVAVYLLMGRLTLGRRRPARRRGVLTLGHVRGRAGEPRHRRVHPHGRRRTRLARRSPLTQTLSPIVVFVGATAKIYPVFGLPAYLFLRRRAAALVAISCAAAFASTR